MNIWELIILQPVINVLVVITHYLFNSFGLAIIALTIITRLAMYPLTARQLRTTKAMQSLQPKMAEIQKKYGRDREKLAQEQMRLYKELGVSPAGCMLPMLVQMPIWIALYQAIMLSLAVAPEALLNLSRFLYDWPVVYTMLPLDRSFLWLDLSTSDFFLALLVGASMWVQQKMTTPASADSAQSRQTQMMLWMMPLMFFFFSLNFPSGLSLYWAMSNIISIVMQYFATGWGNLMPAATGGKNVARDKKYKQRIARVEQSPAAEVDTGADIVESDLVQKEGAEHGGAGDQRQERRPSYQKSLRKTGRQPRSGRRHYPKRR